MQRWSSLNASIILRQAVALQVVPGFPDSESKTFLLRSRELSVFAAIGLDGGASSSFLNVRSAGIRLAAGPHGLLLLSCDDSSGITVLQAQR